MTMMDRVEKLALALILVSAALWAPEAHRMIADLVAPSDLEQRVRDLEQMIGGQDETDR